MNSRLRGGVVGALFVAAASMVVAQGGGPGAGSRGMRAGPDNTMGWAMMTRPERMDHRNKLDTLKTYDECKAYMDQHHAQMTTRAQEQGRTLPAQPRRDLCAGLKTK